MTSPVPAPMLDYTLAAPRNRRRQFPLFWPLLVLALLLLFNLIVSPGFFKLEILDTGAGRHLSGSLVDVFRDGARVMLLSLGMTLVIATGGIDLSVGSVMAVAGCVAASLCVPKSTLFESWHLDPTVTVVVSLALFSGLLAGAYNGILVSVFNIQPIVATLVLMITGRGVAALIAGGFKPAYAEGTHPGLDFIGHGPLLGIPFPLYIVAFFALLTMLLTRRTAMGLFIESIGNNPSAASLVGIHSRFVKFCVYAFTGVCAAMAGLIQTTDVHEGAPYTEGLYMELDAIVAVAIGGTSLVGGRFSIAGSLLGALIMQTLRTTILSSSLPSEFTLIVQAIVVLIICLLQSEDFRRLLQRLIPISARGVAMKLPRLHAEKLPLLSTIVVFFLMYAFACSHYDRFFTLGQSVNFFKDNAYIGIVAVGMTFVILSGGIDLSVGAVVGFTSILYAKLVIDYGFDEIRLIPVVLFITAFVGAFMGALIHFFKIPPFLITLAGMFLYRGTALVISTSTIGKNPHLQWYVDHSVLVLRSGAPHVPQVELGLGVYAFVAFFLAGIILQSFTTFGRSLYAIGGNEQSALLMGLPVGRNKILVYALSGLCAGVAGIVQVANQGGGALNGMGLELDVIAIVVIGGTLLSGGIGSVWGTLFGLLIYALIYEIVSNRANIDSAWIHILIGQLLLAFILLQKLFQFRKRPATS